MQSKESSVIKPVKKRETLIKKIMNFKNIQRGFPMFYEETNAFKIVGLVLRMHTMNSGDKHCNYIDWVKLLLHFQ